MRWVGFALMMLIFVGGTGAALMASAAGWGLPGKLDDPVVIRQGSTPGPYGHRGHVFLYFGVRHHYGGSYGHGK